jgi:hypothetical protein
MIDRTRTHPEEHSTIAQMEAITEAPMAPCGHLVGFLPAGHPEDPEACIAARQAHVDALMAALRAGTHPEQGAT